MMDIRYLQVLGRMLHDYAFLNRPIDGADHDAVCYIAARLADSGNRLNDRFDKAWEKGVRK